MLRSNSAADFTAGVTCLESDDGSDSEAQDLAEPANGTVYFYLVRAQNDCPVGQGSLGETSAGDARTGAGCP